MWMMQSFEDVDFTEEVVFKLLVEFGQVDGLDGDIAATLLKCQSSQHIWSSKSPHSSRSLGDTLEKVLQVQALAPQVCLRRRGEVAYRMDGLVDRCKTASTDLFHSSQAAYSYLLLPRPPQAQARGSGSGRSSCHSTSFAIPPLRSRREPTRASSPVLCSPLQMRV